MYGAKFVSSPSQLESPYDSSGYLKKAMMTWVLLLVVGVACLLLLAARWTQLKIAAAERLIADIIFQKKRENEMKALSENNALLVRLGALIYELQ